MARQRPTLDRPYHVSTDTHTDRHATETVRLGDRETEKQQQPNYDILGAIQQSIESHHTTSITHNSIYLVM